MIVLSLFSSAIGPVPSPFDCYLANRGLKTLHLRMRQHQVNATAVARFLEKNPRVERVIYPGKTTGVCMPYHDTGLMLARDWQRWGILLPIGVFWFDALPTNLFGKFQFSFMPYCSKTFVLYAPPPPTSSTLSLRISNKSLWGGYGKFSGPHNFQPIGRATQILVVTRH